MTDTKKKTKCKGCTCENSQLTPKHVADMSDKEKFELALKYLRYTDKRYTWATQELMRQCFSGTTCMDEDRPSGAV